MKRAGVKILHITTHLGGGVGRALSSIVTYERKNNPGHTHKILLLEAPEKDQFVNACRGAGVEVLSAGKDPDLPRELSGADIVVLHWWHHPVMAKFLAAFPGIPIRLVLWSHVNGCNYPCLPFKFADLPQKAFFTSPFSFENPTWTEKQRERLKSRSAVVYGLGMLDFPGQPVKIRHSGDFVVGYAGTLSDSKIHPGFVDLCGEVLEKVPSARFVLVGDVSNNNAILRQARTRNIAQRFTFTGYSRRIETELAKFDMFAYPLNPKHFGTTENVLLEAMAFGLPVLVFNQNAEKYIVRGHRKVGLLANNARHYAESVKYLYDHPGERARIGNNAREYVKKKFAFGKNVDLLRGELEKVLRTRKKTFEFSRIFGAAPAQWFLSCLGEEARTFAASISRKRPSVAERKELEARIRACSPILRQKTKSSIIHFAETFPEDKELQYWKGLLKA